MRSPSRDARTQPVPSMSACADGSASTANTASGAASIVSVALTRSASMPGRRLSGSELIVGSSAPQSARAGEEHGAQQVGATAELGRRALEAHLASLEEV